MGNIILVLLFGISGWAAPQPQSQNVDNELVSSYQREILFLSTLQLIATAKVCSQGWWWNVRRGFALRDVHLGSKSNVYCQTAHFHS